MKKLIVVLTAFFTTIVWAKTPISIASKMHTEAQVLTELTRLILQNRGYEVTKVGNFQSLIIRKASLNRQFDIYYDYTGTAYALYQKGKDKELMKDAQALFKSVQQKDLQEGLHWQEPLQINNTYTLMMRTKNALDLHINTVSDLASFVTNNPNKLTLGVNPEFWERPDGMKQLMKVYGFAIPRNNVKLMDAGLMYLSLKEKKIDIAMGYATDGRIKAFSLKNLKDDKNFFPVYNPALIVQQKLLDKDKDFITYLRPMWKALDEETMTELNYEVSGKKGDIQKVCLKWLKEKNLL